MNCVIGKLSRHGRVIEHSSKWQSLTYFEKVSARFCDVPMLFVAVFVQLYGMTYFLYSQFFKLVVRDQCWTVMVQLRVNKTKEFLTPACQEKCQQMLMKRCDFPYGLDNWWVEFASAPKDFEHYMIVVCRVS
jgi:hypothetical protein